MIIYLAISILQYLHKFKIDARITMILVYEVIYFQVFRSLHSRIQETDRRLKCRKNISSFIIIGKNHRKNTETKHFILVAY